MKARHVKGLSVQVNRCMEMLEEDRELWVEN